MTEEVRKQVEAENAKPPFFVAQNNPVVIKRGRSSYDEKTGSRSGSLHVPICEISDYIEDQQGAAELIANALNEKYKKEGWS